jgi:AcrR family transcriptional regulator
MLYLPKIGFRHVPRQERSRALVKDLLEAADTLFVNEGFEAVTVTRIAERAGVAIGSLYQYFDNKEAILVECIRQRMHRNLDAFAACLETCASLSFEHAAKVLTACVAASLAHDYPLRMLFISHLSKSPETDPEIPARYERIFCTFLRARAPTVRDEDIRATASDIIHSFAGLSLARENVFADRAHVERTAELFLAVLRSRLSI